MSTTNQAVDSRRRSTDGRLHRRGDARARAELTERYLPLACSLARRYRNCGEPLEDLVQVASLGLVMAIDRWEPERGLEFSSFAVPTILGQLRRHFRDHGWVVRPPRRTQALPDSRQGPPRALGRARPPTERGSDRGVPRSHYEDVLDAVQAVSAHMPASLQEPRLRLPAQSARVDEPAVQEAGYARVEDRVFLDALMPQIDNRAREVFRLRFDEDLAQAKIAERIECSQTQVSRTLRDALNALRKLAHPHAPSERATANALQP